MTPDTIEAVADAILQEAYQDQMACRPTSHERTAQTAIQADRQALAEQGYVIVNKRDVRTAVEWLDEALIDSDMVEEVWNQVSESRNCLKKVL